MKSTNFQFSRCYVFVIFGNNLDIVVLYDKRTTTRSGFMLTPMRMTLNDLERPIHLKVRSADGKLDLRLLWLSDLTMRDRTALLPVRSIPRWRPAAILKISNRHISATLYVCTAYTLPSDAVKTLDAYEIRHLFSK